MKKVSLLLTFILMVVGNIMGQRYVGGDISLLPEYEKAGAGYKTHKGEPIADLVPWLRKEGMNAMRVRLFVNPKRYAQLHPTGNLAQDPNACQDLEYIIPLCKRIVNAGIALMLDFHYSDTWADPAKQWTPVDWEGLSDAQLYDKVYSYTKETLQALKKEGIIPDFIQPGNEISYGMLWGPAGTSSPKKTFMGSNSNWERLGMLLSNAIKACREECPQAGIVIHTERVAQVDVQNNFYDKMRQLNVDYDIIGLSYYPYFHGPLSNLDTALSSLQNRYADKKIMIVETGYSYKWEVPGTTTDLQNVWPYTDEGQNMFAKDLVSTLEKYKNCNGLFWWWMEYNAYGTGLQGWYNAPLFDSTTGCATSALQTICSFAQSSGINEISAGTQEKRIYNLQGFPVKEMRDNEIYIVNGKKVLKK